MTNFENLSDLKSQLFDAPSEVKNAFNQVVEFFDSNDKRFVVETTNEDGEHEIYAHWGNQKAHFDFNKSIDDIKVGDTSRVGHMGLTAKVLFKGTQAECNRVIDQLRKKYGYTY